MTKTDILVTATTVPETITVRDKVGFSLQTDHVDVYVKNGSTTYFFSVDNFGIREWKNGRARFLKRIKKSD